MELLGIQIRVFWGAAKLKFGVILAILLYFFVMTIILTIFFGNFFLTKVFDDFFYFGYTFDYLNICEL